MFNEFKKERITHYSKNTIEKLSLFLDALDIQFDSSVDVTINLFKGESLIATASAENNLIKCIGIHPDFQSEGLLNTLFTELITYKYAQSIYDLSLFTKSAYEPLIQSLGFYTVCKTDSIVFMENSPFKFSEYLKQLPVIEGPSSIASIVMNLNPITNGHLYLIEKAASENDWLYLFIVSEDKSAIPFEVRYALAENTLRHIKNLTIIEGGPYIISSTTFPSYFLKDFNNWLDLYCEVDLTLFSQHIAKHLHINSRYVGSEPYCLLTNRYNQIMSQILPEAGIKFIQVERLTDGTKAISASRARSLAEQSDWKSLSLLVPKASYTYLKYNRWRDL
jgi:[citrate (pro-3S)-lyase] ligase